MGAKSESLRTFIIKKKDIYENGFTQIDTESLGVAAGVLTLAGLKLYLYLVGNKNEFMFNLSPLAYGRWLGRDYCVNGELDQTQRNSVNKMIRSGLDDLAQNGFIKKINDLTFEFYETSENLDNLESSQNKDNLDFEIQNVPQNGWNF